MRASFRNERVCPPGLSAFRAMSSATNCPERFQALQVGMISLPRFSNGVMSDRSTSLKAFADVAPANSSCTTTAWREMNGKKQ